MYLLVGWIHYDAVVGCSALRQEVWCECDLCRRYEIGLDHLSAKPDTGSRARSAAFVEGVVEVSYEGRIDLVGCNRDAGGDQRFVQGIFNETLSLETFKGHILVMQFGASW